MSIVNRFRELTKTIPITKLSIWKYILPYFSTILNFGYSQTANTYFEKLEIMRQS
jgi:hypothetical protein